VKEGIFDGPQIRKLMKDTAFADTMSDTKLGAWNAFKDVVKKFLGNVKTRSMKKSWEICQKSCRYFDVT
jgi:hypothetical protein